MYSYQLAPTIVCSSFVNLNFILINHNIIVWEEMNLHTSEWHSSDD